MENKLGEKYLSSHSVITDNENRTKWKIASTNDDGFVLAQITSIGKGLEYSMSFNELLEKFDAGTISITGYDNNPSDQIILHQVVNDIVSKININSLNSKISNLNEHLDTISEDESEFKSGGSVGKIKYNKKGFVTEIKNKYGKVINQVQVSGKVYKRDENTKFYVSEDGSQLTKEESANIALLKRETEGMPVEDQKKKIEDIAEGIIRNEIYLNQDSLVNKLLSEEILSYDDIQNLYVPSEEDPDESMPQEIFEWWAVSDWLKEKLLEQNEPILDTEYGTWWGRTMSGQMIIVDGTIQRIVKQMNKFQNGGKVENYQGWRNYQTWNVKLWLDNDEGSQSYWDERANDIYDESKKDKYNTKKENAIYQLAQELKDFHEENNPLEGQASTYTDLLNNALSDVDYREIAASLLEEKKNFGGYVDESGKAREFKYVKLIPFENGLKVVLTEEGIEKVKEEGLSYQNAWEYFEDVQGNSEYMYHNNMGEAGFGMTDAEGITEGFVMDDDGQYIGLGNDAKVYWFPNYAVRFWGDDLMEDGVAVFDSAEKMARGGKVDVTKNFYRFRQSSPKNVTTCAVPDWAEKVAESVKPGAKIVTCKKDNTWFIQSILIPRKDIKQSDARSLAEEIKSKISVKKKALGGVSNSVTYDQIAKTKKGLQVLIDNAKDEKEKTIYKNQLTQLQ